MADNFKGINFPNYFKNVAKSVSYTSSDIIKNQLPAVDQYRDTNSELIRATVDSVKNINRTVKSLKAKLDGAPVTKDVRDIIKNALSDASSGKWHNKERIDSADIFGLGTGKNDPFKAGFDENIFDSLDFGDKKSKSKSKTKRSGSTEIHQTNVVNNVMQGANFERQASLSVKLSKAQMANADKNAHVNHVLMTKFHHAQVGELKNINQNMATMVGFANDTMNPLIERTLQFYDETITLQREMKALLQDSTEIQKMLVKNTYREEEKQSDYEKVMGYNGIIDFKQYGKVVSKNALTYLETTAGISLEYLKGMGGNPLKEIAASPLSFMAKIFAQKLIPDFFKAATHEFNESLKNFGATFMLRMDSMRNSDNPLMRAIGSILGLDTRAKKSVSLGVYEKGPVPFDGVTRKAIVDVIPTYLRKIHAAVAGLGDELVMNYDKGQMQWASDMKEDFDNFRKNSGMMGFSEFNDALNEKLSAFSFADREEEGKLREDFKEITRHLRDNLELYNPTKMDDRTRDSLKSIPGMKGSSVDFFQALVKNMSYNDIRRLASGQVAADQQRSKDFRWQEENASMTGYAQMEMGNAAGSVLKKAGPVETILTQIRRILVQGIVVFPKGGFGGGDIGGPLSDTEREILQRRSREEEDYIQSEKDEVARIERERQKLREQKLNDAQKAEKAARANGLTTIGAGELSSVDDLAKLVGDATKKQDAHDKANKLGKYAEKKGIFGDFFKGSDTFFQKTQKAYENPFKMMTSLLGQVDKKMYELVYGKDADPKGDKEEKGMIENLAHKIRDAFLGFATNFKEKVIDRMVDKFLNPMWSKVEEKVFKPLGVAWGRGMDHMFGVKGADGKRLGGVFGGVRDEMRGTFGNIKDFFIKGDNSVWGEMKVQTKAITRGMGDYLFGKGHWMTDKDGKEVLFGRERGGLFTSIGDAVKDLGSAMFGKNWRDRHGSKFDDMGAKFKKWLPAGATGAGLGLIGSMFLPGGPLLGAAIGATLNIARKSGQLNEWLYGQDGNSGLFGKRFNQQFRDEFKGKGRKITAGAGLGYIGGMFLPGGPITGAVIGAGLTAVQNSDTLQKVLYGEKDVNGERMGGLFSKEFQKRFPAMKTMAGVGVLGSLFLPGGPVTGAIVGGILGAVGSNKTFKRWLWGDFDKETGTGKRGLFQRMGSHLFNQVTAPFKNFFDKQFEKTRHTMMKHVMNPLRQAMAPIGTEIKKMFKNVGDRFSSMLNNSVGGPILKMLTWMLSPIRKLGLLTAGGIAASLRGIISLPGRGLRATSNYLTRKQIMRGDITYEEAQARFQQNAEMDNAENQLHAENMDKVKQRRRATNDKVRENKDLIRGDKKYDRFERNVHDVAGRAAFHDETSAELRRQMKEAQAERSPWYKRAFMNRAEKEAQLLRVSQKMNPLMQQYSDHMKTKRQEIIDQSGLYDRNINEPDRANRGVDTELGTVGQRGDGQLDSQPQWKYEQEQMAKTDAIRESELEKHLNEQAEQLRASGAKSVGENVVLGIVDGIHEKRPELEAAVEKLGLEGIKKHLEEKLDIHSPSRVMMAIGRFITQGLVKGIEEGSDDVKGAVNGVIPSTEDMKGKASQSGGLFGGFADKLIGKDFKQQQAEKKQGILQDAIIDTAEHSKKTSEHTGSLLKGLFGKAKNAFGMLGSLLGGVGKVVAGLLGFGPLVGTIASLIGGVKTILTSGFKGLAQLLSRALLGKTLAGGLSDLGGDGGNRRGGRNGRGGGLRGGASRMTGRMGKFGGKMFLFGAGMNMIDGIMSGDGIGMDDVTDAMDPRTAALMSASAAENMATNYLSSGSVGHRYTDVLDDAGNRTGRMTKETNIIGKATDAFYKAKEKFASTKVGEKVIAGASGVADASKSIWDKFMGFLKSDKVKKVIPDKVIKAITEVIPKVSAKITGKAAAGLLAKIVARFTPWVGPALIANDFVTGVTDVKRIFEIPPDSEPSWGMRMASGVSRLISGFTFGLIDERWLADIMYKLLAGKEGKEDLDQMRQAMSQQTDAAGFGDQTTKYSDVMNKGLWQKVGNQFGLAETKRQGVRKEITDVEAQLEAATDPTEIADLQSRLTKLRETEKGVGRTWWEATGDGAKGAWNATTNVVSKGWGATKDFASGVGQKADEFFGKIKEGFGSLTSSMSSKFNEWVGNPLKDFAGKIGNFMGGMGDRVTELGSKVKEKWQDVKDKAGDVVEAASEAIKKGVDKVKEKAGDAVDAVKDTAKSWWNKGKSFFGMGGPVEGDPNFIGPPSPVQQVANGIKMNMPVGPSFPLTSKFGPRTHPVTGQPGTMHKGVDFGAPTGTPIQAVADGTVTVAANQSGYGNVIYLDHGNGVTTRYAHLNSFNVRQGDTVKAGQQIATVGNTGMSTGPHLHFEVRKNNEAVDPMPYIKGNVAVPLGPSMPGVDAAATAAGATGATEGGSGNPFMDLISSIGGALTSLITGKWDTGTSAAGSLDPASAGLAGAGTATSTDLVTTGSKGDFIKRIAPGAIKGFQQYGVLPSLTLAQGILESGWGKKGIGNNLFGIKAGGSWTGATKMVRTAEYDKAGNKYYINAPFRDYPSIDDSVADHAKLLSGSRYKNVIAAKNYREATLAVKQAGYATDPNYPSLLNGIIESNGLMQYDKQVGRGGPVEKLTGKGGPIEMISQASKVNTENTSKIQATLSNYQSEMAEKINKTLDADAVSKAASDVPWDRIIALLEDISVSNKEIAGNTSVSAQSSIVSDSKTEQTQNTNITASRLNDKASATNLFLGKAEQQRQRTESTMRSTIRKVASGN